MSFGDMQWFLGAKGLGFFLSTSQASTISHQQNPELVFCVFLVLYKTRKTKRTKDQGSMASKVQILVKTYFGLIQHYKGDLLVILDECCTRVHTKRFPKTSYLHLRSSIEETLCTQARNATASKTLITPHPTLHTQTLKFLGGYYAIEAD
ncbi:hypothetical protein EDD85DRAFT_786780 [Armillaria nabsnona]|nr:hypothetical protein EDD85DRAFT_786780 [Armillaria nabsnona]